VIEHSNLFESNLSKAGAVDYRSSHSVIVAVFNLQYAAESGDSRRSGHRRLAGVLCPRSHLEAKETGWAGKFYTHTNPHLSRESYIGRIQSRGRHSMDFALTRPG